MDTNILDLHLDVLILIFEQIEAFEDKKNLAKSHTQLWIAFCYQNRKDVKPVIKFGQSENYMVDHWDFLLEWWGSSVTRICNKCNMVDSGDLIEAAAKFCPNLEFIKFYVHSETLKKIEQNLNKLRKLKEIRIRMNYFIYSRIRKSKPVPDIVKLIKSLQTLPNLRILNFGSYKLNENERYELNKLKQLEELKLGSLKADGVDDLSDVFGNVRLLKIQFYPDSVAIKLLAKRCEMVEWLRLSDQENKSYSTEFFQDWGIPYFPKLTYLKSYRGIFQKQFLNTLDSRYNDQLQVLDIPFFRIELKDITYIAKLRALRKLFCKEIHPSSISTLSGMQIEHISYTDLKCLTKLDLLRLVKESSALKILESACRDIDKEFFLELLEVLEKKGFQSDRPFELSNTNWFQSSRNSDLLKEFASLPKSTLMNLQLYDYYSKSHK